MTDYRAQIEALDAKRQHIHTQGDLALVSAKAHADLTEDDFTQIGFWHGERAVIEARERRAKALTPAAPEPPPVTNKAAAYVTGGRLKKAFEAYSKGTMPVYGEAFKKQKTRIDELEARLATLEAKPFVKFLGTWERGRVYQPGSAVVKDSALWICKAETPGEPSKDFVGWQLAVRRGAAG